MALRVTTTGTDVYLDDLGVNLVHPTVNYDLTLQFTAVELRDSLDLTVAIQGGFLTVDDGNFFVANDDYDPDEFLIQQLGYNKDRLYISHDELASGDILIKTTSGIFPIAINSTASVTRNIYIPGGRFITWQLDVSDKIVIAGNAAAGTYTVESITDQQNFIVVQSIPNSTGGTANIYHPPGATRIGIDPTNLSWTGAINLQEGLEDLSIALATGDEKVRVTANDAAPGYLLEQLEAGTGVTLTELNDGGNEKVRISVTPNAGQFDPNTMVLDCDGSLIYICKGDIVICDIPLPGPVTDTNCDC